MKATGAGTRVLIYRITGRNGPLRVPEWICRECDLTVAAARAALSQAGLDAAALEVRPWLTHLGQALRRGGWHPPVVLVDGAVVSQGRVPEVDMLVRCLRKGRASSG